MSFRPCKRQNLLCKSTKLYDCKIKICNYRLPTTNLVFNTQYFTLWSGFMGVRAGYSSRHLMGIRAGYCSRHLMEVSVSKSKVEFFKHWTTVDFSSRSYYFELFSLFLIGLENQLPWNHSLYGNSFPAASFELSILSFFVSLFCFTRIVELW
jgi:hypothetical protein